MTTETRYYALRDTTSGDLLRLDETGTLSLETTPNPSIGYLVRSDRQEMEIIASTYVFTIQGIDGELFNPFINYCEVVELVPAPS